MQIGILTTGNEIEDNRLLEAAEQRGHHAELLYLPKCSISVCLNNPEIYYEGRPIAHLYDVIIPRVDVPHTEFGMVVLRQFQSMHICTTDRAQALELGRDKLRCLQRLLRDNIPFPTTGYAHSKEDFDNIIKTVGGVPVIIKLIEGTEGIGVFLADDLKHAKNILKTFQRLSAPLIIQEFIEESAGSDIRAFVIDGHVIAAMQRQSQDGDFRANIALGGRSAPVLLSPEEQEIAINAAKAIGINIAGIDLIRSRKGTLVIEINTAPNFSGKWGLEEVSGVDVAGCIIDYAVQKKHEHGNKSIPKILTPHPNNLLQTA